MSIDPMSQPIRCGFRSSPAENAGVGTPYPSCQLRHTSNRYRPCKFHGCRTIIPLYGFGHTEEWKWLPTSERRITRDGDPMHTPTLARIIVECAVLGAAVVPDRQRTNLPAESAGKLWLNGMRHQKIENRPCLGALEPIERLRVIAYVERFAAGLRMGPHKRMRGFRLQVAGVAHLGCHLLVAGVTAVSRRTYLVVPAQFLAVPDIPALDALEHLFHRIG